MTDQDNLTENTLPGDAQLTSADGNSAESDAISLAELKTTLGKEFKDSASALKAIKDTFSYVGKKSEPTASAPVVDPALNTRLKSMEENLWFAEHPEYKDYRSLITSMGDPAEVIEKPEFKAIFEKVKVADEVTKTKSVVQSNPRLAQSKTVMEEAVKIANSRNADATMLSEYLAQQIRLELEQQ